MITKTDLLQQVMLRITELSDDPAPSAQKAHQDLGVALARIELWDDQQPKSRLSVGAHVLLACGVDLREVLTNSGYPLVENPHEDIFDEENALEKSFVIAHHHLLQGAFAQAIQMMQIILTSAPSPLHDMVEHVLNKAKASRDRAVDYVLERAKKKQEAARPFREVLSEVQFALLLNPEHKVSVAMNAELAAQMSDIEGERLLLEQLQQRLERTAFLDAPDDYKQQIRRINDLRRKYADDIEFCAHIDRVLILLRRSESQFRDREEKLSTAHLLSRTEELASGLRELEERGVQQVRIGSTLMYVADMLRSIETNQARSLIQKADEYLNLVDKFLAGGRPHSALEKLISADGSPDVAQMLVQVMQHAHRLNRDDKRRLEELHQRVPERRLRCGTELLEYDEAQKLWDEAKEAMKRDDLSHAASLLEYALKVYEKMPGLKKYYEEHVVPKLKESHQIEIAFLLCQIECSIDASEQMIELEALHRDVEALIFKMIYASAELKARFETAAKKLNERIRARRQLDSMLEAANHALKTNDLRSINTLMLNIPAGFERCQEIILLKSRIHHRRESLNDPDVINLILLYCKHKYHEVVLQFETKAQRGEADWLLRPYYQRAQIHLLRMQVMALSYFSEIEEIREAEHKITTALALCDQLSDPLIDSCLDQPERLRTALERQHGDIRRLHDQRTRRRRSSG